MSFRLVALAISGSVALAANSSHVPARSLCRIWSFHSARHEVTTHFLATALPDTVDSGRAGPPRAPLEAMSASTPPGMERVPRPGEKAYWGQLVRLERVGGNGNDELRAALAGGRNEAVLVPWGYRADCAPIAWDASARWIAPGASGFFTAMLRPRAQWAGERPTFDVATAWHQPYPHGQFLQYDRPEPGADSLPHLTAAEYFELYEALPHAAAYRTDRAQAATSVRAWASANPDLVRRYPATEVIQMVEHLATYRP